MEKSLRLGIFIVATLVIFSAGVFWIGSAQFRFSSTYRLNAEFENVAGLQEGASVRVGGVREGSIKHIVLPRRPDQKVRVEMDMKGESHDVIKKDSVASIQTEGLVGDQFVEVTFGSTDAASVKERRYDPRGTAPANFRHDQEDQRRWIPRRARWPMSNRSPATCRR